MAIQLKFALLVLGLTIGSFISVVSATAGTATVNTIYVREYIHKTLALSSLFPSFLAVVLVVMHEVLTRFTS